MRGYRCPYCGTGRRPRWESYQSPGGMAFLIAAGTVLGLALLYGLYRLLLRSFIPPGPFDDPQPLEGSFHPLWTVCLAVVGTAAWGLLVFGLSALVRARRQVCPECETALN